MALVFHLVPARAEPVSLAIATGFAVAAGVLSLLRLSRRAASGLTRVRIRMLAGAIGLEPTTLGFGDRCSTN